MQNVTLPRKMKECPREVQNLDKIYKLGNVKRNTSKKNEKISHRSTKFG